MTGSPPTRHDAHAKAEHAMEARETRVQRSILPGPTSLETPIGRGVRGMSREEVEKKSSRSQSTQAYGVEHAGRLIQRHVQAIRPLVVRGCAAWDGMLPAIPARSPGCPRSAVSRAACIGFSCGASPSPRVQTGRFWRENRECAGCCHWRMCEAVQEGRMGCPPSIGPRSRRKAIAFGAIGLWPLWEERLREMQYRPLVKAKGGGGRYKYMRLFLTEADYLRGLSGGRQT